MQTVNLLDTRQHAKELHAQRELADKAEASRFTDLRPAPGCADARIHQRETVAAAEIEKAVAAGQRELRSQLELINHTLASRLGEIEGRLEARADQRAPRPGQHCHHELRLSRTGPARHRAGLFRSAASSAWCDTAAGRKSASTIARRQHAVAGNDGANGLWPSAWPTARAAPGSPSFVAT